MSARILVADHVSGDLTTELGLLEPLGARLVVAPGTDEATLVEEASSVSAIAVCYAQITEAVLEAAAEGGCRLVARYGIGVDNVDLASAARLGISVTNVPDYCLEEVADHTFALLLAVARGVVAGQRSVSDGAWAFPRPLHRLRGARLALVGFGRIGRLVATRAEAFAMTPVIFDPHLPADQIGWERAGSLVEAVEEADFVSLHLPLTSESRNLIDADVLSAMRRSPVLVNTSRGGLVDLQAAESALDAGMIRFLALDVTDPEPLPPQHPLRRHPRALVTPHMAFYSEEAEVELCSRVAEEIARSLAGRPPRSPVEP